MMRPPDRWSFLSEPLKGAGYVIALALVLALAGAAVAGALVWVMT